MKLSSHIKNQITETALAQKFDPLYEAQKANEHAFARELYNTIPDIAAVADYPEGWLPTTEHIKIQWANGNCCYLDLGLRVRVPNTVCSFGIRCDDPTMNARHTDLKQKRSNIDAERKECKREIQAVLAGCSTVKRLLEVWPEAEALLPTAPPPPAVQTADKLRSLLYGGEA